VNYGDNGYFKELKMNQKQFAKLTGLSKSFVSMWLSGARKPGYQTSKALSEQFGLPIEFFAESDPESIRLFVEIMQHDED
jgi:transcriptional regulator with XRE-family HTH domain